MRFAYYALSLIKEASIVSVIIKLLIIHPFNRIDREKNMSTTKPNKSTEQQSNTLESSNDYFCNEKQNNIVSTSFETLNPLDIICYEEDAEEFELFHTSEETYISDK